MALVLTIGIDFGTTFSSSAFTFSKQPWTDGRLAPLNSDPHRRIVVIHDWDLVQSYVVPSKIAYPRIGAERSRRFPLLWGYDVDHSEYSYEESYECIQFAKARILKNKENEELLRSGVQPGQGAGVRGLDPVRDYLACLHSHLMDLIRSSHPLELQDENLRIQYVVGVPSAWRLPEQLAFMKVVAEAGMPNAARVPEPEAMAAFYCSQNGPFMEGEILIIIDAGGGTVDAVTERVQQAKPLKLSQCGIAKGSCCGATLTTKDKLDNLLRKIEDRFENTFKIKFTGNESFTFMVNPRRTDGTLVISSVDMRELVFDPVIKKVIALIEAQRSETLSNLEEDREMERRRYPNVAPQPIEISAIILGGGFSRNKYFQEVIRQSFQPIIVKTMPDTQTDVVQWLIHIARDHDIIAQRRSTLNYGVIYQHSWNKSDRRLKQLGGGFHEISGEALVPVVEWLILRGQPVEDEMCFDRHRIEKWSDDSDWTAVHEFVVTEDDLPLDQGHTLWSEVEEKCQDTFEIVTSFDHLDRSHLKQVKGPKGIYWEVDLFVVMKRQDGKMTWSVESRQDTTLERALPELGTEANPHATLGTLLTRGEKNPNSFSQAAIDQWTKQRQKKRSEKRPTSDRVLSRKIGKSGHGSNHLAMTQGSGRSGRINKTTSPRKFRFDP